MKKEYLNFYDINFTNGKYCTKSWGFAAFEAGAASRQAEIDALKQEVMRERERGSEFFVDCENMKAERDALQKRVDVLTTKVNEMAHIFLDDLEEILEGESK